MKRSPALVRTLALVAILAISLAACSGGEDADGSVDGTVEGPSGTPAA